MALFNYHCYLNELPKYNKDGISAFLLLLFLKITSLTKFYWNIGLLKLKPRTQNREPAYFEVISIQIDGYVNFFDSDHFTMYIPKHHVLDDKYV